MDFNTWINTVIKDNRLIYPKRLSDNDTGATGAHQDGVYIGKKVADEVFPKMKPPLKNPDQNIATKIVSHGNIERTRRAVYYTQKTRDEVRITQWDDTNILDPINSGRVLVFAFNASVVSPSVELWLCSDSDEAEIEEIIGKKIPSGQTLFYRGEDIKQL